MDGVDILNTVYKGSVPDAVFLVVAIICLLSFMLFVFGMKNDIFGLWLISAISGLLFGLAFFVLVFVNGATPSSEMHYHLVTIDDTVNLTEFYEQYDILEVQGKIFKIREK